MNEWIVEVSGIQIDPNTGRLNLLKGPDAQFKPFHETGKGDMQPTTLEACIIRVREAIEAGSFNPRFGHLFPEFYRIKNVETGEIIPSAVLGL